MLDDEEIVLLTKKFKRLNKNENVRRGERSNPEFKLMCLNYKNTVTSKPIVLFLTKINTRTRQRKCMKLGMKSRKAKVRKTSMKKRNLLVALWHCPTR